MLLRIYKEGKDGHEGTASFQMSGIFSRQRRPRGTKPAPSYVKRETIAHVWRARSRRWKRVGLSCADDGDIQGAHAQRLRRLGAVGAGRRPIGKLNAAQVGTSAIGRVQHGRNAAAKDIHRVQSIAERLYRGGAARMAVCQRPAPACPRINGAALF